MRIPVESDPDAVMVSTLLEPGSMGGTFITPGDSPITVFAHPDIEYEKDPYAHDRSLTYVSTPDLSDHLGPGEYSRYRRQAMVMVENRFTARFYEKLLRLALNDDSIDLRHILTGVTRWTGEYYHDLGFIAAKNGN